MGVTGATVFSFVCLGDPLCVTSRVSSSFVCFSRDSRSLFFCLSFVGNSIFIIKSLLNVSVLLHLTRQVPVKHTFRENFGSAQKKATKKSTVTLLRIVIPYFLTEYFCISFFQRFTYCVDYKLLLAMLITFPDEAVRGVRRNANFQMSQIGRWSNCTV